MYNAGQTCCAAKRFILVEPMADKFLAAFKAALGALHAADPLDAETTLGPLSSEAALVTLLAQVKTAIAHRATPQNPAFRDKFFGPVAMFFRVQDEAAASALANDSDFGLGGSVFTQDLARGQRVASQLGDLGIQEFVNKKPVRFGNLDAPA